MIDFTQLRNFQQITKSATVTQAAQKLHTSQAALSRSISHLEDEFGVRLFNRENNRLVLNSYGKVVLEHTNEILTLIDDAVQNLKDLQELEEPEIRFASSFTPRDSIQLMQTLRGYMCLHPDVSITHNFYAVGIINSQLKSGALDIAVTSDAVRDSEIEWHFLYRERIGLLMSQNNPLAKIDTLTLWHLQGQHFIQQYADSDERLLIDNLCSRAGIASDIRFSANAPELAIRELIHGNGISLTGDLGAHANLLPQGLTFRFIDDPELYRNCGYAVLRGRYLSKHVRQLALHIEKCSNMTCE